MQINRLARQALLLNALAKALQEYYPPGNREVSADLVALDIEFSDGTYWWDGTNWQER